MRTAHKLLTVLAGQTMWDVIRAAQPLVLLKMNESSGAVGINTGTGGTAYNAALTAVTVAQAGWRGALCWLYDGATSLATITADATLRAATTTRACFIKPSGAGEAASGSLAQWGAAGNSETRFHLGTDLISVEDAATTDASSTTSTLPSYVAWQWIFRTYDDTGDRKIHIYKGISRVLAEFGYSAGPTAAVGLITAKAGLNLVVGNDITATRTFAGLYGGFCQWNRVLTTAEMTAIVKASGV